MISMTLKKKRPCKTCNGIKICNNKFKNCPLCWYCGLNFLTPLKDNTCDICKQAIENSRKEKGVKQKGIEEFFR